MKFLKHNIGVCVAVAAFLLTPFFVVAQTDQLAVDATAPPAELAADETVSAADLGVVEPRILPGNLLYGFKTLWRGVRSITTFDPVKKAELKLQHANERIIEAQKLIETEGGDAAAGRLERAMERYERDLEKVEDSVGRIQENIDDSPELAAFVDRLSDSELKRHKVLQGIQENVPEQVLARIATAKERGAGHFGGVIARVVPVDQIDERLGAVLERQQGSEFKEFKNAAVFREILENAPEEARAALQQVEKRLFATIGEKMLRANTEERVRMQQYVAGMDGNEAHQLGMFDDIGTKLDLPDDVRRELDAMKQKSIQRFSQRMQNMTREDAREAFLEPFQNGDPEDLRVMTQLQAAVIPELQERIKQSEDASIAAFKQRFIDDSDAQRKAEKFRILSEKMNANPDPTTFAMIQQLEQGLTDEQREFVSGLKDAAADEFTRRVQDGQQQFLQRITSADPEGVARLQELRDILPPQAQRGIERALDHQVERIHDYFSSVDDTFELLELKRRLEEGPALEELQRRRQNFADEYQQQERRAIERDLEEFDDPQAIFEFRERYEREVERASSKTPTQQPNPSTLREFDAIQQQVIERRMDQFTDPEQALEFKRRFDESFDANDPQQKRQDFEQGRPPASDQLPRSPVKSTDDQRDGEDRQRERFEQTTETTDGFRQEVRQEIRREDDRSELRQEVRQRDGSGDVRVETRVREEVRVPAPGNPRPQPQFQSPPQSQGPGRMPDGGGDGSFAPQNSDNFSSGPGSSGRDSSFSSPGSGPGDSGGGQPGSDGVPAQ